MRFEDFRRRPKALVAAAALALGLGGLGAAGASRLMNANPAPSIRLADPNEGPSRNTFAPVVKRALPAVVNISSSKVVRTPNMGGQEMDPFFRQFFGGDFGR